MVGAKLVDRGGHDLNVSQTKVAELVNQHHQLGKCRAGAHGLAPALLPSVRRPAGVSHVHCINAVLVQPNLRKCSQT